MQVDKSSEILIVKNYWFLSYYRDIFPEKVYDFNGWKGYEGQPIIIMRFFEDYYVHWIGRMPDWLTRNHFGRRIYPSEKRIFIIFIKDENVLKRPRFQDLLDKFKYEILEVGSDWNEEIFDKNIKIVENKIEDKKIINDNIDKVPENEEKKPKIKNLVE